MVSEHTTDAAVERCLAPARRRNHHAGENGVGDGPSGTNQLEEEEEVVVEECVEIRVLKECSAWRLAASLQNRPRVPTNGITQLYGS